MYQEKQRRCDCGCKRPAVLFLLSLDLAFATKCVARYYEGLLYEDQKLKDMLG